MRDRGRARVWAICRCFCCFVLCIFKFFSFRFLPLLLLIEKYFSWQLLGEYSLKLPAVQHVPRPTHTLFSWQPVACLPASLRSFSMFYVHCFICLIILHSFLCSLSLALQSAVATFYWNEIPVFFFLSISRFQFYFSFFHIFCNNLYSWCVPACRWALSLSHGWCSTTVYWLEFPPPSPPLWRTPLCVATLILNSFRTADCSTEIGANVWVIGSGEFKMI